MRPQRHLDRQPSRQHRPQVGVRIFKNEWIRASGAYDAVIDFDAATLDPNNPAFFLPAFNSGDNLHPSDAGYEAMAQAAYQVLRRELK
jgi:lysophospholipase L1-like esterase